MAPYLLASLEVSAAFYSAEHEGRNWRHLCSSVQVPWGLHDCRCEAAG